MIDASIPLSVRKPEFMSPAQAISLQSMVQQLQAQKLQQTQALSTMQKQAQIQQRLSQPDAIGPDGLFTPVALSDITKLDASVGTHITGQVQHIRDEQAAAKSRQLSDQANTLKLGESLQKSQNEVLESAVSFVDSTMPNASQEEKDRTVRQKVQEGLERQQKSALYPYTEEQWKNLRQYPYSYGDAKARITTPKELATERKEAAAIERGEETPDIKNIRAMLKARGLKDGTPEFQKAFALEMGKITAKKEGITVNMQNPLGPDPDFWYEYYDKTKTLPPMAWGQAGNPTREKFLSGFPEWKKKQGGTASDTAASQATFKSNASALTAITKDLNTFEPYKKMLDTNADIAIQLGRKIQQTAPLLVNKPLNWLRQNATTNPDVAEYLAQMRFVQTEGARVINNPRIVGQLTDEARLEMDQVVNGNAPIAVVERVLNRLKADGTNRFNAMRQQQQEIVNSLKGVDETSGAIVRPYKGDSGKSLGSQEIPAIGEVRKGYRFKGGDPSDKNSWEKQ